MKRFEIALLIRHPTLDPDWITRQLGVQPHRSWMAGSSRLTPKGTQLPGLHQNSCWNHVYRYEGEPYFSEKIEALLDRLAGHRDVFAEIDEGGGKSEIFLMLPGDTSIGDELTWRVLKKFADLKIAFSLETFPDMP